jgi:hypothetical protein
MYDADDDDDMIVLLCYAFIAIMLSHRRGTILCAATIQ